MYTGLPSGKEQGEFIDSLSAGFDRGRLTKEIFRMVTSGFLPRHLDKRDIGEYLEKGNQWLEIFENADAFVRDNLGLVSGREMLTNAEIIPVTQSILIDQIFWHIASPSVYKVDRENRYSKFDHPDAKRLRMSALRAIFVDTGTIKYLKARYNDSSEEKKLRKKYPNNACVGLRNEIPFVEENPGKESYLILHPNFVFRGSDRGFYNSYGHFQVTESHYHTELVLPSVSYLVLYDRDVSNDVNSLVMRKVAKRDDGHVEVTTLCLEPKPVFVHYSSATDELRYAVPIHIKLDAYDVVPGTDSPDAMQGPLNEQEVAAFMF